MRAWQQGDASSAELAELERYLRDDPRRRRELVESVLLDVHLFRRYSPAGRNHRPFGRRRILEGAAAALVLAVCAGAVGRLLFTSEDAPVRPSAPPAAGQPVSTLSQAIDRALVFVPGVPIKVEFENEDGKPLYSVDIAHDGAVTEVEIDSATGALHDREPKDKDKARLLGGLKITLQEAVEKALQKVPGHAEAAKFVLKGGGRPFAEVKVLGPGGTRTVRVDAQTGETR
jgi:uncharacterized membrane protein YkoI